MGRIVPKPGNERESEQTRNQTVARAIANEHQSV
jgi:hypothetical protein